ncbi:MAG TPA: SDR family NAD(P)-dependent oxidoreductase, partial [Geminicoccus sp.]|uniref:SDR family NAD(P)-dependent oxidoreductase n=1 Tax=Geminicoccus sp. TaxID=2024832 RepID=UPI002C8B6F9F
MSEPTPDTRELLKRALLEIRSLKGRLATLQGELRPPVAVIGMACRFPGGADDPHSFWDMLLAGRDPIGPVPPGRAASDGPPLGGFLDDVESFDPAFFEITPREAQAMDPQHRLLLETSWQALADAGLDPTSLRGSRTGVFVGLATNDFARRTLGSGVDRFYGSGTSPAVAAGRIAYALDLKGPCLTLDTACSSSLTAAHLAVRALRAGECDLALVGGVSLMLSEELSRSFAEAGMLAKDGRCKSFDAAADGYGRAEGVGVVVLRRLADAGAEGDRVHAVIRGSAVNQDGRSAGLTAPNGPAQMTVIRAALADADLAPDAIDLIEAHGSGTPLGDVIEAQALASVFAGRSRPLLVGTVKSVIGHAEAAAGMAGLIRAVQALVHDTAPPNLHFRQLNPEIRTPGLDFQVPTRPVSGIARVGVSSFGFSGSNAHLVLERAPPAAGSTRSALSPPVFRRQRFPLPGAPAPARLLHPDDPLLAGTGGLAHLGVLLHLLPQAGRLEAMRFEQPLQVDTPREVRWRQAGGETLLESREEAGAAWTVHLAARSAASSALAPPVLPLPGGAKLTADQLYRRIEAAGFRYGPQARCLAEIRIHGDDCATGTLLPGLTLGEPGVIEAAAQLLYALAPDVERRPPMLAGCAALSRAEPDATADRAWLRIREGGGGVITADFGVLGADGTPLALVEGARFARRQGLLERFGQEIVWDRLSPPASPGTPSAVIGSSDLPWPTAGSVEQARSLLQAAADPLLLAIAPELDPKAAIAWLGELVRGLEGVQGRLLVATQGAVATGRGVEWPGSLGGAALWGLAQAIGAEQPERTCRLVDLDPAKPVAAQADLLALECRAADAREVAWRHGRRLARRLRPMAGIEAGPPARAVLQATGAPPQIGWEPHQPSGEVPAGHVLVEVVAAGLNFRDRLVALGLRPADLPLGADLAGTVRATGAGVTGLLPGDAVVALAQPALCDQVLVPAALVRPAPLTDLVAAATMPLAYATALAACGEVEPGRMVLVHQAAGATGLAAVEVARAAGATVHATASTAKQPALQSLGLETLADSRDRASWLPAPVDLAIGAFGPALAEELPARRIVDLTGTGEHGFDLDRQPDAVRAACLAKLDVFPALPCRPVARADLAEAIAAVGEGIGRSVLVLREPPRVRIEPRASYLVTGAAGALGQRVARWLAAEGAALVAMLDLAEPPAMPNGLAVRADLCDEAAMAALIRRIDTPEHPLRGVFHAAAVVEDGPVASLDPQRIARVLDAKVGGALVLHRLTSGRRPGRDRLDHFVLFSSIVSLLPSASQGAYAAANAVLDRLAQERRAMGLAGLSLNLGPVDAGIGQRMGERAHEVWQHHGIGRLDADALVAALPELLATPFAQRAVVDIDWAVYGGTGRDAPCTVQTSLDIAGLQALLAPIVGVARPELLDPDAPLLSLGIDSLMAVEFAQAIGRASGRPVPRTFVYSHANLRAAAETLQRQAAPAIVQASARNTPAAAPASELDLLAPAWIALPAPSSAGPGGWRVLGESSCAAALRERLPPGDDLLDLRPLDGPPDGSETRRCRLLEQFSAELRRCLGTSARMVWVCWEGDTEAELLDGLIATARTEYPGLRPRRILLPARLADPAAALAGELGREGHEPVVLLQDGV